jgi:lipopolysaccharide export system protein LptC
MSWPKQFLLLLLPVAALATTTQVTADKPVINFRLPTFTPEGYRAWLVRGSEARFVSRNQIDITELTLTIFTGRADDKIETMILSPTARVRPDEQVVSGDSTIRVINDQFEAAGTGWRFTHREKKVSINRNVRVTFRAEFKDLLK